MATCGMSRLAQELAGLELHVGPNTVEYRCGGRPVVATIHVFERWERLVISDGAPGVVRRGASQHVGGREVGRGGAGC